MLARIAYRSRIVVNPSGRTFAAGGAIETGAPLAAAASSPVINKKKTGGQWYGVDYRSPKNRISRARFSSVERAAGIVSGVDNRGTATEIRNDIGRLSENLAPRSVDL
jgi:hypothetical protein